SPFHQFFFSSRRRHTRFSRDWSSDVCSSDLVLGQAFHNTYGFAKREVLPHGSKYPGKNFGSFGEVFLPNGCSKSLNKGLASFYIPFKLTYHISQMFCFINCAAPGPCG